MKVRAYVMGRAIELEGVNNPTLEVEFDDGRTVQLVVNDDGGILLRGWGNIPSKLGNSNSVQMYCDLQYQEPKTCHICWGPIAECNCGENYNE